MKNFALPFYEPWIGQRYYDESLAGVRLLLVGESSYERGLPSTPGHLREDTQDIACGAFEPRTSGFWRHIQRSITGKQTITQIDQELFWHQVAIVNLIQRPMPDERTRPCPDDFRTGAESLYTYIDELRPDGVIVYSKSSWDALISVMELKETSCGQTHFDKNEAHYPLLAESNRFFESNLLGKQSPVFLLLRHPSSRPKIAGTAWHPLIAAFVVGLQRNKAL